MLATHAQRLPAGGEDGQLADWRQQCGDVGRSREHPLAVVQQEQQPLGREEGGEGLEGDCPAPRAPRARRRSSARRAPDRSAGRDRRRRRRRDSDRGFGADLQRQPGLAGPTRARSPSPAALLRIQGSRRAIRPPPFAADRAVGGFEIRWMPRQALRAVGTGPAALAQRPERLLPARADPGGGGCPSGRRLRSAGRAPSTSVRPPRSARIWVPWPAASKRASRLSGARDNRSGGVWPPPCAAPCGREGVPAGRTTARQQGPLRRDRGSYGAGAVGKAACTASPSVLNSTPAMGRDRGAQQREVPLDRSLPIAERSRSQSAVEPSISVKRKVTVPWQLGHGPSPSAQSDTWLVRIVSRFIISD